MSLADSTDDALGILVSNLGTPDAPTEEALKRYLKEFLSDRRVVDVPRLIWWIILNTTILPRRCKPVAHLYKEIWTKDGSPLLITTQNLAKKIQDELQKNTARKIYVQVGMRYGNPSITDALEELQKKKCSQILILPLYPQYSAATTASTFDAVAKVFKSWRMIPEFRFLHHYHDADAYISALAQSVKEFWKNRSRPQKLLFSFHGIPQKYFRTGDPYYYHCHKTARLVAEKLELYPEEWQIAFQSRFGKEEWLKPYTDATLKDLAKSGVGSVDVICPGFPADCLETLEEIAVQNRAFFLEGGGKTYGYIPALNDGLNHAQALVEVIKSELHDWL